MKRMGLAYVALVVRDIEGVVRTLSGTFGLTQTICPFPGSDSLPVFRIGESAIALAPPGHPCVEGFEKPGVHHIALAVDDLAAAVKALDATGLPLTATSRPGLGGQPRVGLDPAALAGVRTYVTQPLTLRPSVPGGWVERIDHIGVASADNARALEGFVGRLGCPLESTQTDMEVRIAIESFTSDKYGAVYHSRPPEPVGGLRVAFITMGDCELEFLQDIDPRHGSHVAHGGAGTTRQDQGAVARFVASRGPGLHHLAIKVRNTTDVLGALAKAGLETIDRAGRPGSRRAQIGFLHPRSLGGVLVHFVERG